MGPNQTTSKYRNTLEPHCWNWLFFNSLIQDGIYFVGKVSSVVKKYSFYALWWLYFFKTSSNNLLSMFFEVHFYWMAQQTIEQWISLTKMNNGSIFKIIIKWMMDYWQVCLRCFTVRQVAHWIMLLTIGGWIGSQINRFGPKNRMNYGFYWKIWRLIILLIDCRLSFWKIISQITIWQWRFAGRQILS